MRQLIVVMDPKAELEDVKRIIQEMKLTSLGILRNYIALYPNHNI